MAGDLSGPAGRRLDRWAAELAALLPGPASARAAVLAELRDGLGQAAADGEAAGLPPFEAADAAIAGFGDPATIAAAFGPELAAARARRTALALLASGPLMATLWAAVMVTSAPPRPAGGWLAFPLLGALVAAGANAALLAVAATGRPGRRLARWPRLASGAAATAALACALGDLGGLALLAGLAAARPGQLVLLPAVAAAGASLTRLVLAAGAAGRRLADRAALA